MFEKDSIPITAFNEIVESITDAQKEIFDKKQWDFERLIDLDSKAQTSLMAETGLASALMTAITVALRFSKSDQLSGALATLGFVVGIAQTVNASVSGWKVAITNMGNIEETGKMLDAQNEHRKTDVFIGGNGQVLQADTGLSDKDGKLIKSNLKDSTDSTFRVFNMASRNAAVKAKMLGLFALSVLVTAGWCVAVWDKFIRSDEDSSSQSKPKGCHTH